MYMNERIIWILACLALIVVLGFLITRSDDLPGDDLDSYSGDLAKLEAKIDSMNSVIEQMGAQLAEPAHPTAEPPSHVDDTPVPATTSGALQSYEIRNFQARGLENPEEEIINDLYNNPQLIPHEGVLGGTMGFHSKDNLFLINSRWVFARYEDGHISGEMLLEYVVNPNGTISWTVIRATDL